MTDSPALWCWLDTETTGLLTSRPVVLEAAWMLTDANLRQLTPLRQRLCVLPCQPRGLRQRLAFLARREILSRWPGPLMAEDVAVMHALSGLETDWTGTMVRFRDVQDLDGAIHEDHIAALERLDPGGTGDLPLHLAGAGVAHFEAQLLPMIGSVVPNWLHYRAADSSVAGMTLVLPKVADPDPDDGLELDVQEGCDVELATTAPHRAAADVRAAYRQIRDMRARLEIAEGSRA